MSKADASAALEGRLKDYMTCTSCGAGFKDLILGGDGTWRNTITCRRCFHVRENVPHEDVLVPLIARKYDLSPSEASHLESEAQKRWARTLQDSEVDPGAL